MMTQVSCRLRVRDAAQIGTIVVRRPASSKNRGSGQNRLQERRCSLDPPPHRKIGERARAGPMHRPCRNPRRGQVSLDAEPARQKARTHFGAGRWCRPSSREDCQQLGGGGR